MLGSWIRNGMEQKQIEAEVVFQLIAGSDTTTTALSSTMVRLLTIPRVVAKLQQEIDTAIAEGRISDPITLAEAKKLPYLQAVVREGLRINPPFTGLLSKEVPLGGDHYHGVYIPAGTRIGHNTWSVSRNAIFGADPDVFRPERWLEKDANVTKMEQNLDLLFGYGRWGCLGKPVAYLQMNKLYVQVSDTDTLLKKIKILIYWQLLRNFNFEAINTINPMASLNFNLWLQCDLWVRVTEREST